MSLAVDGQLLRRQCMRELAATVSRNCIAERDKRRRSNLEQKRTI